MAVRFPILRWVAVCWLAVWAPAYWVVWGWQNFLLLCDIAVILSCLAFWRGNRLLLSSQAVSVIVIGAIWFTDFGSRWLLGIPLIGGTEYMWDERFPLWVRALSIYHLLLPLALLYALRRVGYDPRALRLQAGIAAAAMIASRFFDPQLNLNTAFRDPILGRSWGPAPVHLGLVWSVLVGVIYWPTHGMFVRWFPIVTTAPETTRRR